LATFTYNNRPIRDADSKNVTFSIGEELSFPSVSWNFLSKDATMMAKHICRLKLLHLDEVSFHTTLAAQEHIKDECKNNVVFNNPPDVI
jgi:hypothetical protein